MDSIDPKITWGVNGKGEKFYLCRVCEKEFGYVDPYEIKHECKHQPATPPH